MPTYPYRGIIGNWNRFGGSGLQMPHAVAAENYVNWLNAGHATRDTSADFHDAGSSAPPLPYQSGPRVISGPTNPSPDYPATPITDPGTLAANNANLFPIGSTGPGASAAYASMFENPYAQSQPFNAPGAIDVASTVTPLASPAVNTISPTAKAAGRTKQAASSGSTRTATTDTTPPATPAVTDPTGAGNLIGTTGAGQGGIWGTIPNVPDPTTTAGTAISGDLANLGNLLGLAGQTNTFNNQQAIAPYIANLPGYQNMINQSSQNIQAGLQGQVPQDVIALLQQQGAERGISTGQGPGSDNANAAYLRALGLTSLGQQQQAESNLTSAIQRTPTAPLFNVASFLNTPADQQEAQMMANLYASAPNPQQQGQFLMSLFQKYLNGLGGGGGGPVTTKTPGGGGGVPTDLFGNPISQLGANAGGPGEVGGGVTGGPAPTGTSGLDPSTSGVDYNDPTWQYILDPVGFEEGLYGNYNVGGTNTGTAGTTGDATGASAGGFPSLGDIQGAGAGTGEGGINLNDPVWQSILDPTGFYMGNYGAAGQAPQDITPAGMSSGTPDFLNPNFDWSSLISPSSSGSDFSASGLDLGGG